MTYGCWSHHRITRVAWILTALIKRPRVPVLDGKLVYDLCSSGCISRLLIEIVRFSELPPALLAIANAI